jgi:hypothetical protein
MTAFIALGLLSGQAKQLPLDPAIAYMGKLVGKWDGAATAGGESFKCKFTFAWNDDHRGIHSDSILGADQPNPTHSTSLFGYDANAKAAYYIDAHGSDQIFAGHVYLRNGKLEFEFNDFGKPGVAFVATEWFQADGRYISEVRQSAHRTAPPMVRLVLTRVSD